MKPFTALFGAAAGTHTADQLALATLPLTATLVLGAGPDILGLLVAAQSAAWLLVTLPAGAWVDRMPRRTLLLIGLALGLAASVVAVIAAAAGITSLLGVAAFVGASGTVVYMLTAMSLLPSLVPASDLPRSNARLELARAIVSLAAPFVAGLLAQHFADLGLCLGSRRRCRGARLHHRPAQGCRTDIGRPAAFHGRRDPDGRPLRGPPRAAARHQPVRDLLELRFLRPARGLGTAGARPAQARPGQHGPCPVGLRRRPDPGCAGGPHVVQRLPPLATLIFGPAVSVIAAALFLMAPSGNGFAFAAAGHFLIGFGPMLWLICQTTVRQLVTPAPMLGRVNATVQTAIYGVRPLGALAGGIVAAQAGLQAALLLIAVSFVLSTLVIVLSPLARLRALPQPVAA